MRKGGGKQKGSQFERVVAKELSLWISEGDTPDLLWRTALSGGRFSTGKSTVGAGDLGPLGTSVLAKQFTDVLCTECKTYQEVSITSAFHNEGSDLIKWWSQVKTEAKKAGLIPLLIAKANRIAPIIVLPAFLRPFVCSISKNPLDYIIMCPQGIVIYKYKDFLLNIKWYDLYEFINESPLKITTIRKAR